MAYQEIQKWITTLKPDKKKPDILKQYKGISRKTLKHMYYIMVLARRIELEDINPDFPSTDVSLVVGANDVVNPLSRTDSTSPIYGMPILDVDLAQNIIVMKRSMNPGFAGIQNELFFDPKTMMLFGDAKASLEKLIEEVKQVE